MSYHVVERIDRRTGRVHLFRMGFSSATEKKEDKAVVYSSDDGALLSSRLLIGDGTFVILPSNKKAYILGRGGFGTVLKARLYDRDTGFKNCVVKFPSILLERRVIAIRQDGSLVYNEMKRKLRDSDIIRDFFQEIDYLTILNQGGALVKYGITKPFRHINGRRFKKALRDDRDFILSHPGHQFIHALFEYNEGLFPCIVSEFCDGDLNAVNEAWVKSSSSSPRSSNFFAMERLKDNNNVVYRIPTPEWKKAVHEIYQGLLYMHSLNIAHNDIKPHNIFFKIKNVSSFQITCRIADFGLCSSGRRTTEYSGTLGYMSPELMQVRENPFGSLQTSPLSNDAYSMAFTCLELLFLDADPKEAAKSNSKVHSFLEQPKSTTTNNSLFSILRTMCLSPGDERLILFNEKMAVLAALDSPSHHP
jgi:serine/threonine protein kinase